jgi:hypothetical protein
MISKEQAHELIASIKSRLRINENDLTRECVLQPLLFEEISSAAASARSDVNRTKEELENLHSKLDLTIRDSPENFGISGRVTENAISNVIVNSKTYREAKDLYLDAMEVSGALESMLRTVEQRKSMLRDLVQLFIFQYYSSENTKPVSSREVKNADEEKIGEVRDRNRRRRTSLNEGDSDDK